MENSDTCLLPANYLRHYSYTIARQGKEREGRGRKVEEMKQQQFESYRRRERIKTRDAMHKGQV